MNAILGSRGAGRRVLHTEDDRRGTEFQGETARKGDLTRVREVTGEGVTGGAPSNPTWRGERGVRGGASGR